MSDPSMSSNDGHTTPDLHQDDGNTTESDDCCQDDPVIPDVCGAFVFNLDTPEGERRMRECLDATKWKLMVWTFNNWLRNKAKYGDDEHGSLGYEYVRNKLYSIADDYNIPLDEE